MLNDINLKILSFRLKSSSLLFCKSNDFWGKRIFDYYQSKICSLEVNIEIILLRLFIQD